MLGPTFKHGHGRRNSCVLAGTPPGIISQLNRHIAQVVSSRDAQERLAALVFRPTGSTPDDLRAQLKAEAAQWSRVVREVGIKID